MSRPILIHEARLLPLLDVPLDKGGVPITGTAGVKLVGRFINKRLQHNFGGSAWDVTLEGSVDGVTFVTVPGAGNLTGNGFVEIPDFWQSFRLVSNTVDTLATFSAVLGGLEVDEIISVANLGGPSSGGVPAVLSRKTFSDVDATTGALGLGTHYAQVGTLTASRTLTLSDATKALASSSVPIEFLVFDESGSVTGTNTIVLSPESGTINGVASVPIIVGFGSLTVYTDGTNWFAR